MESFIGIVGTAFLLQLTALPGEKGQLVIAGLATRYNPYMVVAGASTAFGGWTVIEILLGNALKGALPAVYLDGITAGLFFIFGGWLLYTTVDSVETPTVAPEGSRLAAMQSRLPKRLHGFLPSFGSWSSASSVIKTQVGHDRAGRPVRRDAGDLAGGDVGRLSR